MHSQLALIYLLRLSYRLSLPDQILKFFYHTILIMSSISQTHSKQHKRPKSDLDQPVETAENKKTTGNTSPSNVDADRVETQILKSNFIGPAYSTTSAPNTFLGGIACNGYSIMRQLQLTSNLMNYQPNVSSIHGATSGYNILNDGGITNFETRLDMWKPSTGHTVRAPVTINLSGVYTDTITDPTSNASYVSWADAIIDTVEADLESGTWPVYGYYEIMLTSRIEKSSTSGSTDWIIQFHDTWSLVNPTVSTGPFHLRNGLGALQLRSVYSSNKLGFNTKMIRVIRLPDNNLFIYDFTGATV